jgi:hypothetical protein
MAVPHPLAGAAGLLGRVVTVLDPVGYVLVDGLLIRAVLTAGRPKVGDEVELSLDAAGQVLSARAIGASQAAPGDALVPATADLVGLTGRDPAERSPADGDAADRDAASRDMAGQLSARSRQADEQRVRGYPRRWLRRALGRGRDQ